MAEVRETVHYIMVKRDNRGLYTAIVDDEPHGNFTTQKSAWKKAIHVMHYNLRKERSAMRRKDHADT